MKPFIYTPQCLSESIHSVHISQRTAVSRAQMTADELTQKRSNLATMRDAVILRYAENPKEMGANEAAREAFLRQECRDEYMAIADAEESHRRASSTVSDLSAQMEHLKLQLRILEVAATGFDWGQVVTAADLADSRAGGLDD